MSKSLLLAARALPVTSGADMTPTQQRAVTGTAAGAGIGAIGGNAGLGAAAGAGAACSAGFSSISPGRSRIGTVSRPDNSVGERLAAGGGAIPHG